MHPIMILAFILLSAVAVTPISYLALAPDVDPVQVYVGPPHGGSAAVGALAAPDRDPQHAGLVEHPTVGPVATPNHDPRLSPIPFLALNQATLRAEPEPAATDLIAQEIAAMDAVAPSAPTPAFIATETTLYAKDSTRLRAAPSTTADVLAKLAADAPLRAVARSTDGAWWQVSLAGGHFGYVRQDAVTQIRVAKTNPPPAPAPVAAAARPAPPSEWERRSQDVFGYVDKTMSWLADQAGGGTAPKIVRSER
jgi:hypothetical protein